MYLFIALIDYVLKQKAVTTYSREEFFRENKLNKSQQKFIIEINKTKKI